MATRHPSTGDPAHALLDLLGPHNDALVGRWASALGRTGGMYAALGRSGCEGLARGSLALLQRALKNIRPTDQELLRFVEPPTYRDQPIGEFVMAGMLVDRELRDYLAEVAPSPEAAARAVARVDPIMADTIARVVHLREARRGAAHLVTCLAELLTRTATPREAFRRIAARLAEELGAPLVVILVADEEAPQIYASAGRLEDLGGRVGEPVPRADLGRLADLEHEQVQTVALASDAGGVEGRLAARGYAVALVQPLQAQSERVGALALVYRAEPPDLPRLRENLRAAAPVLAAHLAFARQTGALRQAHAALGELFDVAPTMLCAVDRLGRVERTNQRFLEEMELDHDVVGLPLSWLVHPEALDRFTRLWERLRAGETVENARFDLLTKNLHRLPVACEAHWLVDDLGEAATCMMALWNVSAHVAREEAQRRHIDELTAFAHHVAHDLKAPLRTIASFSEMLLDDLPPDAPEKLRENARRVIAAAERGDELVRGLLRFARATEDPGETRAVRLAELLGAVRRELAAELDERAADIAVLADETPLLGQPVALSTLLTNLVSNALRYTEGERPRVEVAVRATEPGWADLSVTDYGVGIPPEEQARVFELFHRAHPDPRGSGVGLAIVQRIAKAHGGRVTLQSAPGQGSRFTVRLPTP